MSTSIASRAGDEPRQGARRVKHSHWVVTAGLLAYALYCEARARYGKV